jgi:hypothetical protein
VPLVKLPVFGKSVIDEIALVLLNEPLKPIKLKTGEAVSSVIDNVVRSFLLTVFAYSKIVELI